MGITLGNKSNINPLLINQLGWYKMIKEFLSLKLLLDIITLMYIFIQVSLVISIINQVRKNYLKTGIIIGILLILFNYSFFKHVLYKEIKKERKLIDQLPFLVWDKVICKTLSWSSLLGSIIST